MSGEMIGGPKPGPAPALIDSACRLEVEDAPILARGLSLADLAHVLMAAEAGIIPAGPARTLLAALLELHGAPLEALGLDPARGDVYSNRERRLTEYAPDAGGWLRTGRARREATNIAFQIALRDRLLDLCEALVGLGEALTDAAEKHTGTIMPDLTYLQHAQPTTLAHYLLGFVFPILRDFERLRACFGRVNRCPGGIGSVNGSGLPLDRGRLAGWLGFEGVVTHTRDAMWQADVPVESMAAAVAAAVNVDRLCEDLQIWVTREFGLAELAEGYSRGSVIMPQKKNPYSLAFVRGATGILIGRLTSTAVVGRTPTGQPDNRIFAYGEVPRAFDLAVRTVRLTAGVVESLTFHEEVMASRAAEGYSQATDLAELIMRESGLPSFSAHRLVQEVVADAVREGLPASGISSALIDAAAARRGIMPPRLSAEAVAFVLDPRLIVSTRTGLGGAAPEPVREMIAETRRSIADTRHWAAEKRRRLAEAETGLLKAAAEKAGSSRR